VRQAAGEEGGRARELFHHEVTKSTKETQGAKRRILSRRGAEGAENEADCAGGTDPARLVGLGLLRGQIGQGRAGESAKGGQARRSGNCEAVGASSVL
jgi:hypothetical protein